MKDNKIKMTWTEFTRNYGLAQDTTTKYIVNNHIYYCQSGLVDDLLKRGFFDYEEITNYYEQEEDESGNYDAPKEIHEWWLVSDWLENKLKEVDEAILETDHGNWYGRCATGQALCLDYNLQKIVYDMDVPELYKAKEVA